MYKQEDVVKYYLVDATIGDGIKRICVQCLETPNEDDMQAFLNYIYSAGLYGYVANMKEISEQVASGFRYDNELFYITNMFEVTVIDKNGADDFFCITGINEPTPDEALEFLNKTYPSNSKLQGIKSITKVSMSEAVRQYDMEYWTKPWDVE